MYSVASKSILLLALGCYGCSPAGVFGGKDKDSDLDPESADGSGNPEGHPQSNPGGDTPPGSGPKDPGLLALRVSVTPQNSLFAREIRPTLTQSCATGACHSSPEVIDLRTLPFDAEGSYAMEDIRRELGENAEPALVQRRLVRVMIDAMQSQYMPPPPGDLIEAAEIATFETWLEGDLRTAAVPFKGRVAVTALTAKKEVACLTEGPIEEGAYQGSLDRSKCKHVESAKYEVFSDDKTSVAKGAISSEAFGLLSTWVINVELAE